jgi:NAD(P)-dependent dehydrogenase (short-subunit alcohol dehydrogenase family)
LNTSMQGRNVLITAGAQGIGLAVAKLMQQSGADIHICDVDPAALERAKALLPGANVSTSLTDVSSEAQVDAMFNQLGQRWSKLDALVNNAGISGPTAPLAEIALADWQRTLDVNLTGVFLCARQALPMLRVAGGGSIVNVSSVAGRLGFSLRTPYSATKFGVVGLTETWAIELGPENIRVNAVLPGIVAGDRLDRIIDAKASATGVDHDTMRKNLLSQVSLRKSVSAEDVAHQILFLCSAAGASISGQSISVCGNVERLG